VAADAQTRANTQAAERDKSASNPGPENRALLNENPNSNMPPATDHGDVGPIWYSFDLTHKRIQEGGWTHQVTQRELPSSKDIAGVNMRLTAGSFRELHWHTADEWSIMLDGNARVTVFNPDGKIFIDDVAKGDLWYFPAGSPHSIQGLGPNGCEFLLVFNQGMFSEDNTFLLSEFVAHTPEEVLSKNFRLDKAVLAKLPKDSMYIFPADLPKSLPEDRAAVGGPSVASPIQYTFKMASMAPQYQTPGGEARIVDSRNFTAAKNIAAAILTIKPGGLRELHWHPNASEWQYYIAGKGRMTVFMPTGSARTVDVNANDVGFVPANAGHYIENTGDTDLVALEMFAANEFVDVSLNNWIRHLPPEMVTSHLGLDATTVRSIPAEKLELIKG
jgi:oxalate decarboxylase